MQLLSRLFARLRPTSMTLTGKLSATELRSLSHDQLLKYALNSLTTMSDAASSEHPEQDAARAKRPPPEQSPHNKPKKRRKEFDMSRYGQRLIALRLTYQGWLFHGFASQATSENTVEHHLFSALQKTRLIQSRESCEYSRSGRTDVGVSAMGQVIGLRVRSNLVPPSTGREELDYVKVINSSLPSGVRVLAWTPVSEGGPVVVYGGDPAPIREYWHDVAAGRVKPDCELRRPGEAFSARFDAVHRSYKYFFVRGALDVRAMQTGARYFEGCHDFRNFCRIDENVTNFERVMYTVEVRSAKDNTTMIPDNEYEMCYIFVKGQAFLWHQVRCMASVLFDVGMRREEPELIKRLLADAGSGKGAFSQGRPHYRMASPTPLLLHECAYPNTVLGFPQSFTNDSEEYDDGTGSKSSFVRADEKLAKGYADAAAKASILHAMLCGNDAVENAAPCVNDANIRMSETKSFAQLKRPRNFLLDTNVGKHVPYDKRACDISVEEKQHRAAVKRTAKSRSPECRGEAEMA